MLQLRDEIFILRSQAKVGFFFFEVCVYLMESPSNRCCSALRVFAS